MNSGPLPIILKDTTVNRLENTKLKLNDFRLHISLYSSVPPSPSPRSFSSGLKEFNNNSGNADTEHLHRELEHQTETGGSYSFS